MSYRAAIIGMGRIAYKLPDNHVSAYKQCKDIELVGFCDIKYKGNKHLYYKDYMVMIEKLKPDIVSVCTPPETHREIVCKIAPFVKGIYVEKPIALTIEDGQAMVDVCKKYDVILQVNHQRLFTIPTLYYSRGAVNTLTHGFSLIKHLFRDGVTIRILEVKTDEPVFELDCTHNGDIMIPLGVNHLVSCLDNHEQSVSSGEKGLAALYMALQYQKETGCD